MVSWIISRVVVLIFGLLYPAYSSYKAVKSKDVREYVKWMMYWIIFALFTTAEAITDMFIYWIPFYYELKIAFVVWLLSPYTKGSSVLYRKFVHPTLSSKEKDIDEYLNQAKDKSYDTLVHYGRRGLNVAANAAVMAASKGQDVLSDRLRSFSMQDIASMQAEGAEPAAATQKRTTQSGNRNMMRSKSESASSKGEEDDGGPFEFLSFDPPESPSPEEAAPSPSPSPTPLPATPPQEVTSEPSPSPSPSPSPDLAQLRQVKRRAPEPPVRASLRPVTRSVSKSAPSGGGEVM